MAPAATAVIPAYKSVHLVGRAINSFLCQDGIDPNVIVVIDDQCRQTEQLASSFGPRVQVVWNERNLGPGGSRNAGLALVQTPFVFFLDSDDWVEGLLISRLIEAIEAENADFGLGAFVNLDEASGRREREPPPTVLSEAELFERWLIGTTYVPPCSVVWRTETVRAIGRWSTQIRRGDDAELVCRALLLGCRFATSWEGEGVYLFHQSPHRVSRQSSRCGDLKASIDKLRSLPGAKIPQALVEAAAAQAYYEVARIAFVEGDPAVGRAALRASRELGFAGHRGGTGARLLGRLLGLENRLRLRRFVSGG